MIKLIRMRSGEDVVGEVTKENEEFLDIKRSCGTHAHVWWG